MLSHSGQASVGVLQSHKGPSVTLPQIPFLGVLDFTSIPQGSVCNYSEGEAYLVDPTLQSHKGPSVTETVNGQTFIDITSIPQGSVCNASCSALGRDAS